MSAFEEKSLDKDAVELKLMWRLEGEFVVMGRAFSKGRSLGLWVGRVGAFDSLGWIVELLDSK